MSHLACSQFRPNFWRPTICAYCYRPKTKHKRTEGISQNRGTIMRGSSDNINDDDWEIQDRQRSATISKYYYNILNRCLIIYYKMAQLSVLYW